MSGNGVINEDDADWSEKNENAFLRILSERVKKDPDGAVVLKPTDWNDMDEELSLEIGKKFGVKRLKGKYHRLRMRHRHFLDLLEHTSVTYDSNTNTVFAIEEVWQMFYKKNKIFKNFRKSGCKNYEMLGQVFNNSTATGHHHSSTQLSPASNDERQNDEESLNRGVHTTIEGKSKGKRSAVDFSPEYVRVKKDFIIEKLGLCMEIMVTSLNARKERNLAIAEKYKARCNRGNDTQLDPYSIDECMNILEEMENVSSASYNNVLEKFKDPDWRRMFVRMPYERKKGWLKSLE